MERSDSPYLLTKEEARTFAWLAWCRKHRDGITLREISFGRRVLSMLFPFGAVPVMFVVRQHAER